MRFEMNDAGRGAYATSDPRMAVWLVLIVASTTLPAARSAALVYALPYVVIPGLVRLAAGGPVESSGPALRWTLLGAALLAGSLGAVTGAGATWWCATAGLAATAALLAVAARRAT